jgi:heme exporter protein A
LTLLAFDRVACRRGDRLLFHGVDFALDAGGALLIEGPNGVGKSSLIRQAAGLLPAFEGRIARAGALALADERAALDPELSLARALLFYARLTAPDVRGAAARGRIDAALAALGLAPLADIPVRILSTGQRRRAALARVLASGAPVWLLDEPANGLDAASIAALGEAMAAHRAAGGAILAAAHVALPLPDAQRIDLAAHAPAAMAA